MNSSNRVIALKKLTELYDSVERDLIKMNLPCKRNCSGCCNYAIFLTKLEGSIILKYLKTLDANKAIRLHNNIIQWLDNCKRNKELDKAINGNNIDRLSKLTFESKIPCPLLLDTECGIYPARPFICRTYFHRNGPDACTTGIKDANFVKYFDEKQKLLLELHGANNIVAEYTLLPLYILEALHSGKNS